MQKQRELLAERVASSDVVVTAAQVFGRKAPVIVTSEMVKQMKAGSVIVDTAVESGGNVEGLKYDEVLDVGGVKIVGFANLPSRAAANASEMLSNNLAAFVEHCWNKQNQTFQLDLTQEFLRRCAVTHGGEICNETIRTAYGLEPQGIADRLPSDFNSPMNSETLIATLYVFMLAAFLATRSFLACPPSFTRP